MEKLMSHILVADIIPIFVVMILGYVSGKKNAFTPDQTRSFNKLVLDYALPAALFISIVKANRHMLFENLGLTILSLVGLVIGIVAIVVNAVTIPIGLYLLTKGSKPKEGEKQENALVGALKEPVVWAPILAVIFVLLGIRVPDGFAPTFDLLAKVNSGVAVFAAGLTLSAYSIEFDKEIIYNTFFKLVLMPAVFLFVGLAIGLKSEVLQMLVLSVALPPAFSGIIIASKYSVYTRTGTSSLAVSMLGFIFAAPFWIYLSRLLSH